MEKIFMLVLFVLMFSCNNAEDNIDRNDDTVLIEEIDVHEDSDLIKEEGHSDLLKKIAESDQNLSDSLALYLNLISGKITREDQIIRAFEIRKKILGKLEGAVFEYLDENQTDYDPVLEEELNKAGFQGVYVEGMFMMLEIAPVLEEDIERVASDEYKLRIKFFNAYASSLGSEYPFDSMSDEKEVVWLGEEIMKKFPDSELFEDIKEKFMRAVSYFTDFHLVTNPGREQNDYIVGGLDIHMYPAGSYRSNFEDYIESLPRSIFTPVVKKMLNNPSVISSEEGVTVFLVVIDLVDDFSDADSRIFNFVKKGTDIPHRIIIRDGEDVKIGIVYRFFSDHNKALEALEFIQEEHPQAEIIEVDTDGNLK